MNNRYLVIAVAVVSVVIGMYFSTQRFRAQPPSATEELFSQMLQDAKGEKQSLAKWKGKSLVVNFWASWCAPCVKEMPELSALQESLHNGQIQIIGIGIDSVANIASFADHHKVSYPLYSAEDSGIQLSRSFGNQAGLLPFTVLLDKEGKIRKTYLGIKVDELRKDLAAL
jgi:peroxiredoxin